MAEGFLEKFKNSFRYTIFFFMLVGGFGLIALMWWVLAYFPDQQLLAAGWLVLAWILISLIVSFALARLLTKPTEILSQAIYHISPNEHLVAAPNVEKLQFGRDLITSLTRQIYDFAANSQSLPSGAEEVARTLVDDLPVPILGLSEDGRITLANQAALKTFQVDSLAGQPLDNQLRLTFQNDDTLESWLHTQRTSAVNAQNSWSKVEIRPRDSEAASYFDIVASLRQKHPSGIEVLLALFDHSPAYETEGEAIGFISLAVHELRTPLTIMRGYIEVFEDELGGNLSSEMQEYLKRLSASAENLTAFVTNILTVAKKEQDQLNLRLSEENWEETLTSIVEMMRQRAAVRGKEISLQIAKNLPVVALDRTSIAEVVTNLVDNAIKYSPEEAKTITIKASLDKDGAILTTVEDKGVGIPESVMPKLFNKFYRNHRNRAQIVGTGLGLYLSKAIVTAHHGNIWVSSKEGEGSTFGFTLMPYVRLAEALEKDNNSQMIRASHGWIKNHSMQRR